jgi:histone arginine demethylase JMJD6
MKDERWQMAENYKPWYVGWANCDKEAGTILREYYERPDFLPKDSESGRRDWIFMGTPGYGAPYHIDNVKYPSWQAQVCVGLTINDAIHSIILSLRLCCYVQNYG